MEIKKIESEDLQVAANLLRIYWKERGGNYSQDFTLKYLTEGHKTEIVKDQFFVIKENNKVMGTVALIIFEAGVAEIRDLVVKKEYRRKGLGKKLIDYLIEFAKHNNVRKIYCLTVQPYRSFYEKCGFELEGFLKNHYKEGEHLIIMSRYLKEKEAKQVDLKKKLEDERQLREIESETTERLMKLRLR